MFGHNNVFNQIYDSKTHLTKQFSDSDCQGFTSQLLVIHTLELILGRGTVPTLVSGEKFLAVPPPTHPLK